MPNPWLGPITIAVAPALNFSGTADVDTSTVADLMASELGHVDRINVIPVSRVLAAMARLAIREVGSPEQALAVRDVLGADVVLVFAITEYDPYEPPIVGIAAQLYGEVPVPSREGLDPVLVSRQAAPVTGRSTNGSGEQPLAQAQRVFNAAHDHVRRQVRKFAEIRDDQDSAYGWHLFLVSQHHYLRFCCWAVIRDLLRFPEGRTLTEIQHREAQER